MLKILSENEHFARICQDNSLVFIGPSADCLAAAGNKSRARGMLSRKGIPIIPGSRGTITETGEAVDLADVIGYPVILKASGGGGGRGMRIANNADELTASIAIASGEAQAGFGNPDLYLEKYISKPRHIEVQVLGDSHGDFIHLGERECSIQYRYQKLIEESPSPIVDQRLRTQLGNVAIQIAKHIGYSNAGTIEFLLDENNQFYFMEVNARIQVEHPVTEMVTGIDLVEQQIRIATGEPLALRQDDVRLTGVAIECRINAADPEDDFMPSPGTITDLNLPTGDGIRLDTHIHPNCEISPFYDSLIGKLIAWGNDRSLAISRMERALDAFRIKGIKVTIPLHQRILQDPDFKQGHINTHFIDKFSVQPS